MKIRDLTLALLLTSAPLISYAQENSRLDDLEAMAHYYVVLYTFWPEAVLHSQLKVCIDQENRLADRLTKLFSQIKKNNLQFSATPLDLENVASQGCQIVILGDDASKNKKIIEHLSSSPVLILSSQDDITRYGGMVYVLRGKPPRINLKSVSASGLRIDSSLLGISDVIN